MDKTEEVATPMGAAIGNVMAVLNLWGLEKRRWNEEGLNLAATARHQRAAFCYMYKATSLQSPTHS